MKTQEILKDIQENGGLDMNYIEASARADGVSVFTYIKDFVKSSYNCHGLTAYNVANKLY